MQNNVYIEYNKRFTSVQQYMAVLKNIYFFLILKVVNTLHEYLHYLIWNKIYKQIVIETIN